MRRFLFTISILLIVCLAGIVSGSILIGDFKGTGRQAEVERVDTEPLASDSFEVSDTVSPVITLEGEPEVSIYQNEGYIEPGFSASDNVDGDITGAVIESNDIDNTVSGIYTVRYEVSDSAGNSAEALRTVKVRNSPDEDVDESVRGLPVLMYHWFYDAGAGETGANVNWMEVSELEEQLQYLTENDFYYPTWDEVYDFIDGVITLPEKSVVLTFDDGHESFFRLAKPLLEEYGVSATSFVITSELEGDEVEKYTSEYLILRSHSHDMHRAGSDGNGRFLTMTSEEAGEDLLTSKEILGVGDVFCYPYGHYSDFTEEVLAECGYKLAFTTEFGRVYPNMDKLALPRVRMSAGDGLNSYKTKVG